MRKGSIALAVLLVLIPKISIAGSNDQWRTCCPSGCNYQPSCNPRSFSFGTFYCCNSGWSQSRCSGCEGGTTTTTTTTTIPPPTTTTTIPSCTYTNCEATTPTVAKAASVVQPLVTMAIAVLQEMPASQPHKKTARTIVHPQLLHPQLHPQLHPPLPQQPQFQLATRNVKISGQLNFIVALIQHASGENIFVPMVFVIHLMASVIVRAMIGVVRITPYGRSACNCQLNTLVLEDQMIAQITCIVKFIRVFVVVAPQLTVVLQMHESRV
ncbi:MAG: hypothetical protein FGF53_06095 [Candidatus Brockarchaeota archaeon]|nr:hypothetical protein [Candidatus Brockarchaeota archaeon]